MLEITIPEQHYDLFDEIKEEFIKIDIKETKIQLEHSLISLSKWEEKYHKPFIGREELSHEELIDYIRCMTITRGIDPGVYNWIPQDEIDGIVKYIKDPMTATTFKGNTLIGAQNNSREGVTAEIIYYWMITLSIPVEFQKWHLSKLLTLIKVVNIKNQPAQKMNKTDAAIERAALNRKRRALYNSKG